MPNKEDLKFKCLQEENAKSPAAGEITGVTPWGFALFKGVAYSVLPVPETSTAYDKKGKIPKGRD